MPMLSLLEVNPRLPSFHMDKRFIWINETKKRINVFTIGYMINLGLNFNKASKEQVVNVCILYLAKSRNLLLNTH